MSDATYPQNQISITQRYDRDAEAYASYWAPVLRKAGVTLLRELSDGSPHRILDVGTGVGTLLPELASLFPRSAIWGVDQSGGMLRRAPAGFGLARMDAASLAVSSGRLDLVLMVFMLFHLERPEQALEEALRVLRPGGRFGCTTWAREHESKATRLWVEGLNTLGASPPDPEAERRHSRVDSTAKLSDLLRAAGFSEVRTWVGELIHEFDHRSFVRYKANVGATRTRLESLSEQKRAAFRAAMEEKLAALTPADFVLRAEVVFAVARR